MLDEKFISSICGPALSNSTAIAKDVGIWSQVLSPSYSVTGAFKKSSVPVNCIAVNDTHIYAAQHEKAYVHVYSRPRGNQEAFVAFPERIRSLALAGDVLVAGTAEGRLMLWETTTGRLVSTPPRHVQAVSCVVATPYHIISGSDDSDIHVWSLAQLLDLDAGEEHEPERTLPNHRAAITSLAASQDSNPDTSIVVSASKDKSCIVWNYRTGDVLRSLLFPSFPLCVALDPASRALFAACEDRSLYLVEFFAEKALLGPSAEDASTVVQVSSPFGVMPSDAGSATCLAVSYDGTQLLTGHPKGQILKWDVADNKTPVEIANLNAAVSNIVFLSPFPETKLIVAPTIIKPNQAERNYTITAQFNSDLGAKTSFDTLLNTPGFSQQVLENAIAQLQQPVADSAREQELAKENEELWEVINEQRALQKETLQKLAKSTTS
ncbi:quinon protein alcohol dehydrogenase-like superfamily [Coniochaeta sp. 2T2.1]|nr:quinon protein alcohol dehydrogenase-like superfamily [Coniochaeta sp. 2T2.1]